MPINTSSADSAECSECNEVTKMLSRDTRQIFPARVLILWKTARFTDFRRYKVARTQPDAQPSRLPGKAATASAQGQSVSQPWPSCGSQLRQKSGRILIPTSRAPQKCMQCGSWPRQTRGSILIQHGEWAPKGSARALARRMRGRWTSRAKGCAAAATRPLPHRLWQRVALRRCLPQPRTQHGALVLAGLRGVAWSDLHLQVRHLQVPASNMECPGAHALLPDGRQGLPWAAQGARLPQDRWPARQRTRTLTLSPAKQPARHLQLADHACHTVQKLSLSTAARSSQERRGRLATTTP